VKYSFTAFPPSNNSEYIICGLLLVTCRCKYGLCAVTVLLHVDVLTSLTHVSILLSCLHCQTLSHNIVSSTSRLSGIRSHNVVGIGTDCICSFKSNYHTITIMMALCGIAKKSHYLIDNQSYLYSVGYCCKLIIEH
jgi:hypothetical protein